MSDLKSIPEIASLDAARDVIRIPPQMDVPVTPRVRQLIDTAEFQQDNEESQAFLDIKMRLPTDIENIIQSFLHIPQYIKEIPMWTSAFYCYWNDVIFDQE